MKEKIIIASYGGSGSTFLAKKIKQLKPKAKIYHTHSMPINGIVGIPTKNLYTGHDEGPLSNWVQCDNNTKVIVIVREPAEAYLSRACFKHFAHIWYGRDNFKDVMNDVIEFEKGEDIFNSVWPSFIDNTQDILSLDKYLLSWLNAISFSKNAICLVKYEHLVSEWKNILSFIEIENKEDKSIENEFSLRTREINDKISKLMDDASKIYAKIPNFINTEITSFVAFNNFDKINTSASFSVDGLNAGFGDSFSRMNLIYKFVKSYSNAGFVKPQYKNYHSNEIEFFEIFLLDCDYERIPNTNTTINIKFSEFITKTLADRSFLLNSYHFNIIADIYDGDALFDFYDKGNDSESIVSKIKMSFPSISGFEPSNNFKAVFHLRRSDIIKSELDDLVEERLLDGIHARRLLTVQEAFDKLITLVPKDKKLEIIVVTDGFAELKNRFKTNELILNRLDNLEKDISNFDFPQDVKVRYFVGKDKQVTIETLYAMYTADLVITRSSCFPNLICEIGSTKLIHI